MAHDIWIEYALGIPMSLRTFNPKTQKTSTYTFQVVTKEELMRLRLTGKPGCVYKKGETLYYTAIPGNLRFIGKGVQIGPHLCGRHCTMVCKGCPRTRDHTVSYQMSLDSSKTYAEAVMASWRAEKYTFDCFEAFGMKGSGDASIVFSCPSYKEGRHN